MGDWSDSISRLLSGLGGAAVMVFTAISAESKIWRALDRIGDVATELGVPLRALSKDASAAPKLTYGGRARRFSTEGVDILAGIPSDSAGVAKTFGRLGDSQAELRSSLQRLLGSAHRWPEQTTFASPDESQSFAAYVRSRIASSAENELVVLFAHNHGGKLRFPDGSTIDLADPILRGSKAPVLLSCRTAEVTGSLPVRVHSELFFGDTGDAVAQALNKLALKKDATVAEFVEAVEQSLAKEYVSTERGIAAEAARRNRQLHDVTVAGAGTSTSTVSILALARARSRKDSSK